MQPKIGDGNLCNAPYVVAFHTLYTVTPLRLSTDYMTDMYAVANNTNTSASENSTEKYSIN